jgi:hypothetical protein
VEPRLIRLCYKYKFEAEFGEPSDGWLDYVEKKCKKKYLVTIVNQRMKLCNSLLRLKKDVD